MKEKMKTTILSVLVFILFSYTASAALTVQSFSCNSQSSFVVVETGGTLACEASIKNTGAEAASISSVSLLTDGMWAEKTSYDGFGFTSNLAAGASTTATFGNIKPTTPGLCNFNYLKIDSITDNTPASMTVNAISLKTLQLTLPESASEGSEVTISAYVTSGGNTEITLTLNLTNCTLKAGESAVRNLGAVADDTMKSASWKVKVSSSVCQFSVHASASSGAVSVSKSKQNTISPRGVGIQETQTPLVLGWNLISLPLII
jgi:hypothetical protein